jgi:regulator of protease activity HflC (stomatin/prohibitin superfamily)
MATLRTYPVMSHLRAEPNQYILHYQGGNLVRRGAGLTFWFNRFSAALAELPVEDIETTMMLNERSKDYQDVSIQVTLSYRIEDPLLASKRVNFGIDLASGKWTDKPLSRLANLWFLRAQEPARTLIAGLALTEVLGTGVEVIARRIHDALTADPEIGEMGLRVVTVKINQVAPTPEMEKALQTPTREQIHVKADEAVFSRRALAVENERAIKENELQTEIELAARQEELIRREGDNRLLAVRQEAEAEHERVDAEAKRLLLEADAEAKSRELTAGAEAEAIRAIGEARGDAEARHVEAWNDASAHVVLGLALQKIKGRLDIQNLHITPDMISELMMNLLKRGDAA